MPEIVSDEYREGYAAFQLTGEPLVINPYFVGDKQKWLDWMAGWQQATRDWAELISYTEPH